MDAHQALAAKPSTTRLHMATIWLQRPQEHSAHCSAIMFRTTNTMRSWIWITMMRWDDNVCPSVLLMRLFVELSTACFAYRKREKTRALHLCVSLVSVCLCVCPGIRLFPPLYCYIIMVRRMMGSISVHSLLFLWFPIDVCVCLQIQVFVHVRYVLLSHSDTSTLPLLSLPFCRSLVTCVWQILPPAACVHTQELASLVNKNIIIALAGILVSINLLGQTYDHAYTSAHTIFQTSRPSKRQNQPSTRASVITNHHASSCTTVHLLK